MRRIIFILLLIPAVLVSQDAVKIRLAVVPFDDTLTSAGELEKNGSSAAYMIEAVFKKNELFSLRERDAIQNYIVSMEKVQLGIANPEFLKADPSSLKIDFLTVGTVSKLNGKYEIDVRTVGIDDMTIIHANGATADNLAAAAGDIQWYIEKQFNNSYLKERQTEEDKPVVTVFKFRDYGENAGRAGYGGTFAEILNSQIGTFNSMSTIERKYSKALVNEKVLEMSGIIENDNSDSNFRAKGIQYKVEGDIRIFNNVITLNYRIVNTNGNSVVYIGSRDIASSGGLRPAAWAISNTIDDVLNNKTGSLNITSTPNDAAVYVDGRYEGKAPLLLSLARGTHKIEAKLDGYAPYSGDVDLKGKQTNSYNITMKGVSLKVFDTATAFEQKKNWSGAVTAYGDIVKAYPGTSIGNQAAYRKGHIEMQYLKNYTAAKATFAALVAEYPETFIRAEAYYGLMKVNELSGDAQKTAELRDYILRNYGETNAADEITGANVLEDD
ncbi:MAG: PEGA domain-containing protein [Spirochaetia bacterium]|jgi:TolB-like protein/outer membrane protein assembly factor BamD (BamD/ComL family)|nr:PEGA domain-containing protein [Spirochaetia bacterium]